MKPLSAQLEEFKPVTQGTAPIDDGRNAVEIIDRASYERMKQVAILLAEALVDIEAEWCKHPDLRFKTSPLLTRDFCSQCHSWVYVGEKTTASEALTNAAEMLKGKP